MGQFRLEIVAQGGHGCQREVKDGGTVFGCGRQGCPDCEFTAMLADYARRSGATILSARIVHWPGTSNEVVDELSLPGPPHLTSYQRVERVRHGSFE